MNKDITLEDLGYEVINEEEQKALINQIKEKLSKKQFIPKVHLEYLIKYLQIDINELQEQIEMLKMTPNGNYISTVETQIAVLIEENKNLQHQLEEKDKVINETIGYAKNTKAIEYGGSLDKYGREFFINEFWFIKDILEILERGKNNG